MRYTGDYYYKGKVLPDETMSFKLGDRVFTPYGKGTIVEIENNLPFTIDILVYHDEWRGGHNGDICRGHYEGNHCQWFYRKDLIPCNAKEISLNTINKKKPRL